MCLILKKISHSMKAHQIIHLSTLYNFKHYIEIWFSFTQFLKTQIEDTPFIDTKAKLK